MQPEEEGEVVVPPAETRRNTPPAAPCFDRLRRIAAAPARAFGQAERPSAHRGTAPSRRPTTPTARNPMGEREPGVRGGKEPTESQTREARPADARALPVEAKVGLPVKAMGCPSRRKPPSGGRLRQFHVVRRPHRRRRRAPLATVRARRLPRRQPPPRVLVARPWRGKGGVKFQPRRGYPREA